MRGAHLGRRSKHGRHDRKRRTIGNFFGGLLLLMPESQVKAEFIILAIVLSCLGVLMLFGFA